MDAIAQFVAVTGASVEEASNMLEVSKRKRERGRVMDKERSGGGKEGMEMILKKRKRERLGSIKGQACAYNLETAVSMYLENNRESFPPSNQSGSQLKRPIEEEEVRAPIPSMRGRLVEDDGNVFNSNSVPKNVFESKAQVDRIRNFKDDSVSEDDLKKIYSLASIFRPPMELMFVGSLEQAKMEGKRNGKWVLVNLQKADEFLCQALNRDLWRENPIVRLVKDHFVFWQINADTPEGEKYKRYYPSFHTFPHIAIIDAQTGEMMKQWDGKPEVSEFIKEVQEFLFHHTETAQILKEANESPPKKRAKVIDMDEEEQMMAAIAASLAETNRTKSHDVCSDEEYDDNDTEWCENIHSPEPQGSQEPVRVKEMEAQHTNEKTEENESTAADDTDGPYGPISDEPPVDTPRPLVTRLQIKMLDGGSLLRRFWRSDSVRKLFAFIHMCMPDTDDRKDMFD
eukprot:Ihof_evm10s95 gene=Ihof_evmTU10s95